MPKAGFFVKDVTPERPVYLAGYPSRRTPSEGVDDPLFLRILALEDDRGSRAVLVTADLLKCPRALTWRTKMWAEKTLGLPSAALMVNLSHSHCVPALAHQSCYPHWALDVDYVREFECSVREGIRAALGDLQPVRIRYGCHQAHFGVNRRCPDPERPGRVVKMRPNPEGCYDPDLPLFTFHRVADERLLGVLFSYGCHPTSKGGNRVSADYPGELSRALKETFGGEVVTLFAQGAGGSVMPRWRCRTDEERRVYRDRWHAAAADMSRAIQSGSRMREIVPALTVSEREFGIPYDRRQLLSPDELLYYADPAEPPIERVVRPASRQILRLWANTILEQLRTGSLPEAYRAHVTCWKLTADLQVVGLSGEVTAELGRLIKNDQAQRETVFLGYCGYTDAYLPTASMLPEEGHEALCSIFFHERPAPFVEKIDNVVLSEVRAACSETSGNHFED